MAHKHNRRRIRPRSRRSNAYQLYESTLPTVYEHDSGYDSISSHSSPQMSFSYPITIPCPQQTISSNQSSIFANQAHIKRWLELERDANAYRSFSNSDTTTVPVQCEPDLSTMRKFGGEPSDGYGLCDKMQEMFDSIGSWMET